VRQTTRGSLKLRVLRKSVYVWDKQNGQGRRYELLVTENLDGQDRKYSLTNQQPSASTQRLSTQSSEAARVQLAPANAIGIRQYRQWWTIAMRR
jgi:hypothetical protein